MKTAEEQLTELRIAHVKNLYKGQPQNVIDKAIKGIERMSFESVEDFETWAADGYRDDPNREANNDELNKVFDGLGLGHMDVDNRTSEEKDLENVFKHLNI